MFSETLEKAAQELATYIHPVGLSRDRNEVEYLIVYTTNIYETNKFLKKVLDKEEKFGNFKVVVRKIGPI